MITRREFIGSAMSLPFLLTACRRGEGTPNIVLIFVDDMGWTGLSSYGGPHVRTSRIDGLAEQGIRFTQAYAAPMCSPSRAALFTGQYPARLHITRALPGRDDSERAAWKKLRTRMPSPALPAEQRTLAEVLKDRGYTTAFLGKWHLGTAEGESGYWVRTPEELAHIRGHFGFDLADPGRDLDKDKGVADLTSKAVAFMETNRERPFFVYLSHHAVHTRSAAPADLVEKYRARGYPADGPYPYEGINSATYLAMIEHLDRETGRLLDGLDRLGLSDNTIVMFVSDNGGATRVTRNDPLRRGKATCYEGGIRVPFIARWPKRIRPGRVCDVPVHLIDIFPTLLDLTGRAAEPGLLFDGMSLVPLFDGRSGIGRESLFFHMPHYICYPLGHFRTTPHGAVRTGNFKLVEHFADHFLFPEGANRDSVIYDPDLAEYVPERKVELFDLRSDIGERRDLSGIMPDKTAELLAGLQNWRRSVGAAFPQPNSDYSPEARFVSEFDSTRTKTSG